MEKGKRKRCWKGKREIKPPKNLKKLTSMKKIKIKPGAEDIKMKIEGSTLEEFFEAGLQGINKIITKKQDAKNKDKEVGGEVIKKINLTASDTATLIVNFLSEVLAYSQEERAVFAKVLFDDLDEKNINAEIYGETIEEFSQDIKSINQGGIDLEKNENGNWEAEITFEI